MKTYHFLCHCGRTLARPYDRAVKFGHQPSEICFACEMQANARVKWRFRESTDVVSLRDEFETSRYKICFVIQQTYHFLTEVFEFFANGTGIAP